MDSVYVRRISIARAMMKDAPIILDEATANVDPENEKELMETIGALTHEKTVRHADQILVVDDAGRIVQRGTHEELMTQEGVYRRFITGREQAVRWKL